MPPIDATLPTPVPPRRRWTTLAAWALTGVLAALAAVAIGQLLATLFAPSASPIIAVGSAMVDLAPQPLKAFAIETFGERDKDALLAGIGARGPRPRCGHRACSPAPLVDRRRGPARGVWRRRRCEALARPTATPVSALPAIDRGGRRHRSCCACPRRTASGSASPRRRRLASRLPRSGGAGRRLAPRERRPGRSCWHALAARQRARVVLPTPMDPAPPCRPAPTSASPASRRSSRRTRTSTGRHGARGARRRPETWSLRIHGMVDREVELTTAGAPRAADDRARHHADLRLERGRRAVRRQRALDRRAAGDRARAGGRRSPAPTSSSRARSTA